MLLGIILHGHEAGTVYAGGVTIITSSSGHFMFQDARVWRLTLYTFDSDFQFQVLHYVLGLCNTTLE